MKSKGICILLPHNYPAFDVEFTISLFAMQKYFMDWCVREKKDYQLSIIRQSGYCIDEMRNVLVEAALGYKQDYFLFLDTDMTFPEQTIVAMIKDLEENEDQGVEAITGVYIRKNPPYMPHVYPHYDKKKKAFSISGQFPTDKLFKVEGAGCGVLMVKKEVFKRVKKPWFLFPRENVKPKREKIYGEINHEIPVNAGEDLYFFLKAKPLTLCDPRIQCGHWGRKEWKLVDWVNHFGGELVKGGKFNQFKFTKEQIKEMGRQHKSS